MKQEKKRINPISSALRPKKRYILFHISSSKPISDQRVKFAISNFFLKKLGPIEAAKYRIQVMKYHPGSGKGIVRCAREKCPETKNILSTIKRIERVSITLRVLKVSGTIKTLKEKL